MNICINEKLFYGKDNKKDIMTALHINNNNARFVYSEKQITGINDFVSSKICKRLFDFGKRYKNKKELKKTNYFYFKKKYSNNYIRINKEITEIIAENIHTFSLNAQQIKALMWLCSATYKNFKCTKKFICNKFYLNFEQLKEVIEMIKELQIKQLVKIVGKNCFKKVKSFTIEILKDNYNKIIDLANKIDCKKYWKDYEEIGWKRLNDFADKINSIIKIA